MNTLHFDVLRTIVAVLRVVTNIVAEPWKTVVQDVADILEHFEEIPANAARVERGDVLQYLKSLRDAAATDVKPIFDAVGSFIENGAHEGMAQIAAELKAPPTDGAPSSSSPA